MKRIFLFVLPLLALAACDQETSPLSRIKHQPVADYCFDVKTTRDLVNFPHRSIMGGSSVYRAEMVKKLAAQEDLCQRQKSGLIPAPGVAWSK